MIDRSTSRTTDEVADGDLAEQSVPVYPDEHGVDERELADAVDRENWSANEADVVEQTIPVPLDDEDFDPGA